MRSPITCLLLFLLLGGAGWPQQLHDQGAFKVYVPKGVSFQKKVPLVLTFSPGGNPEHSMSVWKPVADRYKWIVYGTSSSRNGMQFEQTFDNLLPELKKVLRDYPVDRGKVIATGLSGGGMVSYGLAARHPKLIRAVVVNTGMMHEHFQNSGFPRSKLAVLLASPTDFRYQEMKRDRKFLKKQGWDLKWLEFKGGHTFAPSKSYFEAAAWLNTRL